MPKPDPTPADLEALKKRLSPTLLAHPAVAGIGIGTQCLRVYLAHDDDVTRQQVQAAVAQAGAEVRVEFLASGRFRALPTAPRRKSTK